MTNSPIRQIDKSGQVSIPPNIKKDAGLENGDYVHFSIDENKEVKIKKFIPLVLLGILPLLLFSSDSAFAQEATQTIVTQNGTITTNLQSPGVAYQPVIESTPAYSFLGPTAYYPFRVELIYPTGVSLIQNITKNSPATVSTIQVTDGVPSPGLSTATFSTGMSDVFDIVLGERYSVPIDQVATMTVYANNTAVNNFEIPIRGDHFQVRIKAVTSEPPHTPTADELNAGVYDRLDKLATNQMAHETETANTNRIFSLSANGYSFSIVPSFGSMVFNAMIAAGVIYLVVRNRGFKKTPAIVVRSKEGQK